MHNLHCIAVRVTLCDLFFLVLIEEKLVKRSRSGDFYNKLYKINNWEKFKILKIVGTSNNKTINALNCWGQTEWLSFFN